MLFMTVYTFEPEHRNEVVRRRVEQGPLIPRGTKMIGEWSYLGSGKVFRLVEANDPLAISEAIIPWTDLGKLEVYPVVEVEAILPKLTEKIAAVAAH